MEALKRLNSSKNIGWSLVVDVVATIPVIYVRTKNEQFHGDGFQPKSIYAER